MSDQDDRREAPTDPIGAPPPGESDFSELRPPPPQSAVPRDLLTPDPNSWEHVQLRTIVDGMKELQLARKAFDADALLSRQTEVFAQIVTDRYEMIRGPVFEIREKLDALLPRVAEIEKRLESGVERFERLETAVTTLRGELDLVRTRMAGLEAELETYRKKEGPSGTAPTAEATTTESATSTR